MLKELVDCLVKLGASHANPVLLDPPVQSYWLRNTEGEYERKEAVPAVRNHKAASLQTICDFALDAANGELPVLWYSQSGMTLLVNDLTRHDKLHWAFTPHAHIDTLRQLEKRPSYTHANFLRLLRIDLADTHRSFPDLLPALRAIKIRQIQQKAGEIQHSKVSLGNNIESELSGTKNIPETVTLNVQVFREFTFREPVTCALDIDPQLEHFYLIPLPGEIDAAITQALERVRAATEALLKVEGQDFTIPLYHGVP